MPNFTLTRGTQLIGDTLFIDGSPHSVCAHCGTIIGSNEYERKFISRGATKSKGKIVRDGKVSYESKPYKITILSGWADGPEKHFYKAGFYTADRSMVPKLTQRPGCFDCWSKQQQLKAESAKIGHWAFDVKTCKQPALKDLVKP